MVQIFGQGNKPQVYCPHIKCYHGLKMVKKKLASKCFGQ